MQGDIRPTSAALAFSRTIRLKYTWINCRARNGKIHSKYIATSYLSFFIVQIRCPPFEYRNLRSNLGIYTPMRITRPFNKDEITSHGTMFYQKNFR